MKKVSVIIPCYNQENFISEAISSVQSQTYNNWECIIIDDGSTDNSAAVVVDYTEADSRIKYLYQKNDGVAAARNAGLQEATGDFLIFLDGDDTLNPLALEYAVNEFIKDSNLLIVFSDTTTFGEGIEPSSSNNSSFFSLKDILVSNRIFITSMFQRCDLNGAHFDETIPQPAEDWEFWISLISRNESRNVLKLNYQLFKYRKHGKSAMDNKTNTPAKTIAYQRIFDKHRELYYKFFPDYITLLNRNLFYEKKLEKIYAGKIYKFYDILMKVWKRK